MKDPDSRLAEWKEKLTEYDYKINYIPGSQNCVTNELSKITPLQLIQMNARKRFPNEYPPMKKGDILANKHSYILL